MMNRVQQYTEEKLGQFEKTKYEPRFEAMMEAVEQNKIWTVRIIEQIDRLIQPETGEKIEGFIMSKIGQQTKDRLNAQECLGQLMKDAAAAVHDQGKLPDTLVKVGQMESSIGKGLKERNERIVTGLLQPLKSFLEVDCKNLQKEKRNLDNLRLDLDSARSRVNKAKPENQAAATAELNSVKIEFERQLEITKLMVEQLNTSMINLQMRAYVDLLEIELDYHSRQAAALLETKKHFAASM